MLPLQFQYLCNAQIGKDPGNNWNALISPKNLPELKIAPISYKTAKTLVEMKEVYNKTKD